MRVGALVLAVLAASAWPPWQTVVQRDLPSGPSQHAFVAGSLEATHAFAAFLSPEDRAALASVDYRTRAVVAVFRTVPSTGYTLEIRSLRRRRSRLTIVVALRQPTGIVAPVVLTACHVVSVPRHLLGAPLPRRLVVKVES